MICGLKWKTCDCPWFNLPPDVLRVNDYLIPPLPPLPMDMRHGWGPVPPIIPLPPLPTPPGFMDGRDIPMDPMNLPPMFAPPGLPQPPRPRARRARTTPGSNETPGRETQEAADEAFARQLQDQEFHDPIQMMRNLAVAHEDYVVQHRQRAARRDRRRRVYAVTEDAQIIEYDPATANFEDRAEDAQDKEDGHTGMEATMAGLRECGEGRVESWRRHI